MSITAISEHARAIDRLWSCANAYKLSTVLFTLLEVGVLDRLAVTPADAAQLAAALRLDATALELLLDLMVGAGIVERTGSAFTLAAGLALLLPLLALESRLSATHIHRAALERVLSGGQGADPMMGEDAPRLWPTYLEAMAVGARALAPHLVRIVRGRRQLLDLGGADGALVERIAHLLPATSGVVVDRPRNVEAFRQRIHAAGLQDRFCFVGGDLRRPADLAGLLAAADVVVLSNVLHLLTAAERQALFGLARQHMPPGSQIVIYDQFLSPDSALDAARLMVVDWLLCGYRFDIGEHTCRDELIALGFVGAATRRVSQLPGALVYAEVPAVVRTPV